MRAIVVRVGGLLVKTPNAPAMSGPSIAIPRPMMCDWTVLEGSDIKARKIQSFVLCDAFVHVIDLQTIECRRIRALRRPRLLSNGRDNKINTPPLSHFQVDTQTCLRQCQSTRFIERSMGCLMQKCPPWLGIGLPQQDMLGKQPNSTSTSRSYCLSQLGLSHHFSQKLRIRTRQKYQASNYDIYSSCLRCLHPKTTTRKRRCSKLYPLNYTL